MRCLKLLKIYFGTPRRDRADLVCSMDAFRLSAKNPNALKEMVYGPNE